MAIELMNHDNLIKLAKAVGKQAPLSYANGESYSAEQVEDLLVAQFQLLAGNYNDYRRNQVTVFELIETALDEILPRKVMQQYNQFAEITTVNDGDKAVFTQAITEAARKRAKTFVTRVGIAGRYETFMLDGKSLTVETGAIGSAARIGFEELLEGKLQFSTLTELVMEGMDEYITNEIFKALNSAMAGLPTNNVHAGNGFDEAAMDKLIAIANSYGTGRGATIFCDAQFAGRMLPAGSYAAMSDRMKEDLWNNGHFASYKGTRVVIFDNAVEDITNTEWAIDPSKAYILPAGDQKPVKLVFEGGTHVRTVDDNDDWSQNMQIFRKFGIAVFTNPGICQYINADLKKVL